MANPLPRGKTLKSIRKADQKRQAPQRAADKAADKFASSVKRQVKSGEASSLTTGIAIAAHKAAGGTFPANRKDMNKASRKADKATVKAAKKHGLKTKKHFKGPGSVGLVRK